MYSNISHKQMRIHEYASLVDSYYIVRNQRVILIFKRKSYSIIRCFASKGALKSEYSTVCV